MTHTTDEPLMTLREIAAFLRIHRQTAYNLAQQGRLPVQKVGSQWRGRRTVLDAWLASGISGKQVGGAG